MRVACASASPLPAGAPIELPSPPYLDGMAVLRDGALVLERYENGMQPSTRHLSQSVAKSVLGLLVTVLGLELDTPVTELVPEVGESGYRGATLRHLMDMTAATDFVEDYTNFWRYDAAAGWHSPAPGVPGSVLEYLATIGPAERAHGAVFHYVSPNTDLLGIATARAAGAPLQELLARELWGPIGAEADAELDRRPGRHARDQRRLVRDAARLRPARRVRARALVLRGWASGRSRTRARSATARSGGGCRAACSPRAASTGSWWPSTARRRP